MQSYEEINRCIAETKKELDKQYRHISLRNYPFEDKIVNVIPTKGLYYSKDYYLDHLFFITEKGYYFTNEDILGNDSAWIKDDLEDPQPYAEFLKGIIKICNIVRYNEEFEELRKFILSIMKHGKISATKYLRGPNMGKKHYSYCHLFYSWIGSEYKNN